MPCRYFLRKLKKVKKSHGQILSINEVSMPTRSTLVRELVILSGGPSSIPILVL